MSQVHQVAAALLYDGQHIRILQCCVLLCEVIVNPGRWDRKMIEQQVERN